MIKMKRPGRGNVMVQSTDQTPDGRAGSDQKQIQVSKALLLTA